MKRVWPKYRGDGVITEDTRRAAAELAHRTSNKNAARVYGVACTTVGNWVRAFGFPPPGLRGADRHEDIARWRAEGLPVVPRRGFVPLPLRPKLTPDQINFRANYARRQKRAAQAEEIAA